MRDAPKTTIGQRRVWSGGIVTSVAEVPGWVFVMPDKAGRPFSIAYAVWAELPALPFANPTHRDK